MCGKRGAHSKTKKSVQKFIAYWLDLSRAAVSFHRCFFEKKNKKKKTIRLVSPIKPILVSTFHRTQKIVSSLNLRWTFVKDMFIQFPQHAWMSTVCHKYWTISLLACCGYGGPCTHAGQRHGSPCACMYMSVCKDPWRAGPKWWCNALAGVLWNLASSLLCFLCTARVSYPTTSSVQHAPFNSPDHNRAELNHTRHHEYHVL